MNSVRNSAKRVRYMNGNLVRGMILVGVLAVFGSARGAEQSSVSPAEQERNMKLIQGDLSVATNEVERFYALNRAAKNALQAGNVQEAEALANELARLAPKYTNVWNIVSNWRRAETLTKQCSGELSWITTWNAPSDNAGRPPRRVEYTYKITEPDVLQQIVFDEDQGRDEQIVGINRDYGFRLRRKGEASAWELQYVGTNTEPLWRAFERDGKVCALYWLYIDGKYLLDLFKNPAFHIQSVSDDSRSKSKCRL